MSLQRVFESARKMGVPVIITDPSGREPMIVLPLEQFEAMAGETRGSATSTTSRPAPVQKSEEIHVNPIPGLSKEAQESFDALVMENPEIPLEERFYLETVDEGKDG